MGADGSEARAHKSIYIFQSQLLFFFEHEHHRREEAGRWLSENHLLSDGGEGHLKITQNDLKCPDFPHFYNF